MALRAMFRNAWIIWLRSTVIGREARVVVAHELDARRLLGFDQLRDMLRDSMEVQLLRARRSAGAQDAVDECGKPVGLLDDDARVGLLVRIGQLALEQLGRAAESAERILHLVR